jgi:hypothetical protein
MDLTEKGLDGLVAPPLKQRQQPLRIGSHDSIFKPLVLGEIQAADDSSGHAVSGTPKGRLFPLSRDGP